MGLRRHITTRYRARPPNAPVISGWIIGNRIENMVRESIRQTAAGSYSTLSPDQNQAIIECIRETVDSHTAQHTVLFAAIDVRRFVRKIIENELIRLPVLSFQELGDEAELHVIGNIDLIGED
jgi:type III secretion protein V